MEKLYYCELCKKKEIFPVNFHGIKQCDECNIDYKFIRNVCPLCKKSLYKKHEGWVCKNHKCTIGDFKLGRGWVYLDREREDSILFLAAKYDFDPENFKNIKKWLKMKSKLLYKKEMCEVCKEDSHLHVHHILPRSSHPELAMDEENLMVLCEDCHKQIHSKDKYKFNKS